MNLLASLRILWCTAIAVSAGMLFLYRAPDAHGPDMVAREVSGFVVPLVVALAIAGASTLARDSRTSPASQRPTAQRRIDTPLATLVIGALEVLLYCTVIVR